MRSLDERLLHAQGDLNLNICEAHAFNTTDHFTLDVFVVNGWSGEVSMDAHCPLAQHKCTIPGMQFCMQLPWRTLQDLNLMLYCCLQRYLEKQIACAACPLNSVVGNWCSDTAVACAVSREWMTWRRCSGSGCNSCQPPWTGSHLSRAAAAGMRPW
jgi:hypothetical protein